MDAYEPIRRRFEELSVEVGQIHRQDAYEYGPQATTKWATSAAALINRVFGQDSVHYQQFQQQLLNVVMVGTFEVAKGIFFAAKEDFERGALFVVQRLVRAELFADFLEQAKHLLEEGYKGPAAVVAGAVLEDGLRKLCVQFGVTLPAQPKLDWMNAELAKKQAYDKLQQKQITWLADVRNKAAHGKWDEFSEGDVAAMVRDVGRILSSVAH